MQQVDHSQHNLTFAAMFVFDEDGTESEQVVRLCRDCDTILGVCDELDRKEQA